MTTEHGQLLERPMNIGVTLNYLAEVRDLMQAGLSEREALEEALGVTVVPFCCSLEGGEPDAAALNALQVTLADILKNAVSKAAKSLLPLSAGAYFYTWSKCVHHIAGSSVCSGHDPEKDWRA